MHKSRYVTKPVYPCEEEGKKISQAQGRFDEWLSEKGYVPAVDGAPYDSAEGGYLGTIDTEDLLGEYLEERLEEGKF